MPPRPCLRTWNRWRLLELRHHRSRIGCALLVWTALDRALGDPHDG